jgi:molybdopterin-guanine dinucleotide biosynthesis protein A
MIGFYDQVRVKRITASDTDHYNTDMFFNVNTPGDYEEALRRLERKGKSAQG